MRTYLVLNYGSSSLKAALYKQDISLIEKYTISDFNISNTEQILQNLLSRINILPDVIIHRVVHGMDYKSPFLIDENGLNILRFLAEINPLHNKISLKGIEFLMKRFPEKTHYAVFDTDFHSTIPEYARVYGIDIDFYKQGLKKYGFHGISYSYVLRKMCELLSKNSPNLIILHLGSGCSICAIKEGKSIDTSMGFSPLEGLIMQTRPGDIDPGLVLYLLKSHKINEEYFYFNSGLVSLAKINNFKELEKRYLSNEDLSILAMEAFVYRIAKYIGSYYILFDSIDGIVFTGGIGENSSLIRNMVCEKTKPLGIEIDPQKNQNNEILISSSKSKIPVYVIKTNEEEEMLLKVLNMKN